MTCQETNCRLYFETSKNEKQAQSRSKLGLQRDYDSESSQQDLTRKKHQRGYGLDFQKLLGKTSIEFNWPGYKYLGAGTHLKKRFKCRDQGINRLDKPDGQTTRHRLQSCQEFGKKEESGSENDQGHQTLTQE